ncbi:hypothetical protein Tco_0453951 [Tanacetum coccineum]
MVLMRAVAPSTYINTPRSRTPSSGTPPPGTQPLGTPPILPIPLPTSLLPLPLPSTDRRADVPEAVLPPQKRLCIAPGPRFEVGEFSFAATSPTGGFRADYGFVGTLDAEIRQAAKEIPLTTLVELCQRVTNFVSTVKQDTNEIYRRLDDAQSDRFLITDQLNVLRKDRRYPANTALLVEREARKMPPKKAPRTRTTPTTATTLMTDAAIRALISRGVANALTEHEIKKNNNLNGDGSQGSGSGIARPVRPTHECTYTDFLKCQPLNFKGTKGVVGLTQWFERMKTIFNISNCAIENQVKFSTCTLHGVALTLWKSHVKIVVHDAAYEVP